MKDVTVSVMTDATGCLELRVRIGPEAMRAFDAHSHPGEMHSIVRSVSNGTDIERVGIFDFMLRRIARIERDVEQTRARSGGSEG